MFSSISEFLTKWNRVLIALLMANLVAVGLLEIQRRTIWDRETVYFMRIQAMITAGDKRMQEMITASLKTEQMITASDKRMQEMITTSVKTEQNFKYISLQLAEIKSRVNNIESRVNNIEIGAAKSSSDKTNVEEIPAQTTSRIRLTEPLKLIVDAAAEVRRGAVYANPQAAIDDLRNNYDIAGQPVTISIKGGSYGPINIVGQFIGARAGSPVFLEGASPSSVIINGGDSSAFQARRGMQLAIRGVSFRSDKGSCLEAFDSGTIIDITQVEFGDCPVSQLNAEGSAAIRISGDYTISGDAQTHYSASLGGMIDMESISEVTAIGKRTFSEEFALARYGGTIIHKGTTFVGEFKGRRFRAIHGVIHTQGQGEDYFPGTIEGDVFSGVYD